LRCIFRLSALKALEKRVYCCGIVGLNSVYRGYGVRHSGDSSGFAAPPDEKNPVQYLQLLEDTAQ